VSNPSLEKLIDWEIDACAREEIEYAWRSLCATMLMRTASCLSRSANRRKSDVLQKKTATNWLEGGVGLITFELACDGVDMNSDELRSQIFSHARQAKNEAINKSRVVFGKPQVA